MRRLLAAAVSSAALAVTLPVCSPVEPFRAVTSNHSTTWASGVACEDPTADGGALDIEEVWVTRDPSMVSLTFVLHELPTFTEPMATRFVFRAREGGGGGVLTTRWSTHGAVTVTVRDASTGRTRSVMAAPGLDAGRRSITTRFPADVVGSTATAWAWGATTTLHGRLQDVCRTARSARPVVTTPTTAPHDGFSGL